MNLSRALLLSLALHLIPLLLLTLLPAGQGGNSGPGPETTGTPAPRLHLSLEKRPDSRLSVPIPGGRPAPPKEARPVPPPPKADAGSGTGEGTQAYYYPTAELSRRASLASQLDMSFVDRVKTPGQAIVILFIGPDGRVDEVKINDSNLPAEVENDLRQQFSSARFQPAERAGQPVRSRMQIEVFLGEPPAGTPAPSGATQQNQ